MKTLLLKKNDVGRLIGMTEVIGAVEEAYKAFSSAQVEQPDYIGDSSALPAWRDRLQAWLL